MASVRGPLAHNGSARQRIADIETMRSILLGLLASNSVGNRHARPRGSVMRLAIGKSWGFDCAGVTKAVSIAILLRIACALRPYNAV